MKVKSKRGSIWMVSEKKREKKIEREWGKREREKTEERARQIEIEKKNHYYFSYANYFRPCL